MEYRGVDGTQGTRPNEFQHTDDSKGSGDESVPPRSDLELASRADCQAAALRMVEFAIASVLRESMPDATPQKRQAEVQALITDDASQEDIRVATDECLRRETTQREAVCISRLKSEADIDRCAAEDDMVAPAPPPPPQKGPRPSKTIE